MKKFIVIALCFLAHAACAQETNKIVAKVNNEIVTLRDLESYVKLFVIEGEGSSGQMLSQALRNLIDEKLILQAAKKEGMQIPESWVEGKLGKIVQNYENQQEFEEFLAGQGLNILRVKERIRNDFLMRQAIERYVNAKVAVSPKEITDFYNENISEFQSEPKYVCWVAKSNKQEFLQKVADEIEQQGLEPVLEQYKETFFKIESEEKGLKDELRQVVTSIKQNEYRIKEIDGAYYLVYLKTVVPSHKKFLAEVKDEIYEYLWKMRFEKEFMRWISQLKKDAVIKIYD